MLKFAERLKDLRLSKKMSQRDLAKEINVSQAAIARWENNLQIPNIEIACEIAVYFNVSLDYLVGLEEI